MERRQRIRSRTFGKRNGKTPITPLPPIPSSVFEFDSDTDTDDEPLIKRRLTIREKQKKEELEEGKFRRRKRQQRKLSQFVPEITPSILDAFPTIPVKSLLSIKRDLHIEDYNGKNRKNILKDLLTNDTAFNICNREIGEGFIEKTLKNKKIKGFALSFRDDFIGFVFYFEKETEIKIELICVKKKKGTLKGVPLGQITMEIVFRLTKSLGKKKVALEAVQTPNTLSFYRKLGFRKFGKTQDDGLFLLKKTIK